jgi:subtilisin family serine protease
MKLVRLAVIAPALMAMAALAENSKYIVRYRGNAAVAGSAVAAANGTVVRDHTAVGLLLAQSANPGFVAALRSNAAIEYVLEDERFRLVPTPSVASVEPAGPAPAAAAAGSPFDARFLFRQWNLYNTQANLAWTIEQGRGAVKVAVLDTGICAHHVDLEGKVDAPFSASFVPPSEECAETLAPSCSGCPVWEDRYFHGTHVAAIIASNNVGVASVAPKVQLRAVKIANCRGESEWSWMIAGILYAAETGSDVINISYSSAFKLKSGDDQLLVRALSAVIAYARGRGALVVSSAGNDGLKLDHGPRVVMPCEAGALCVGATTRSDDLSDFSNSGLSAVDLVAPGGGLPLKPFDRVDENRYITSACSRHSTVYPACGQGTGSFVLYSSGTSQAAPMVAGAAALLDSMAKPAGSATPAQLERKLVRSADDLGRSGPDSTFSNGRLNVYRAVQ